MEQTAPCCYGCNGKDQIETGLKRTEKKKTMMDVFFFSVHLALL